MGMHIEFWWGRDRRRLKDKINMNIMKVFCEDGRWVELAQDLVR
jgi:hypothetical protein